jgi:hypothetical protein
MKDNGTRKFLVATICNHKWVYDMTKQNAAFLFWTNVYHCERCCKIKKVRI